MLEFNMAATSIVQSWFFVFLLQCSIFYIYGDIKCENISVASLPMESSPSLTPSNSKYDRSICIIGESVSLYHIWGSVQIVLDSNPGGTQYQEADSCADLEPANQTWTSLMLFFMRGSSSPEQTVLHFSPFKDSCLGLGDGKKQSPFRVTANFKLVDWYFPAAFLLGLIIFYNADRLSRNSLFFYSSGVTLGLLLSLLLVVYILHRLIPRRGGAYAILLGGWSLVAFVLQWTVSHFRELLLNNNQWVIGYILITGWLAKSELQKLCSVFEAGFEGVISFSVCYYYGPVTSNRGLDLIRWALKIVGLVLLYMGTRSDEVSLAVVVIVLISHLLRNSGFIPGIISMLPQQWISYRLYYFFRPPKHTFLSENEYVIQGTEETAKALEELRQYCDSPECNAWRVISRLKHPNRFAAFVAEGQHILDEELKDYVDEPAPMTASETEDNVDDDSIYN